ncbi:hypothetical protein COV13_02130 [Candidatus Woesearchaeota archaeon CG10_big_fil_rev_8_21_14_0_10_32_9]|nr:MAG: hypothetical protein COV13_02130 [Candidatus Woesearchaeota archaeon CG10_big_fil_rev_8_21_14_0_10_32_9]
MPIFGAAPNFNPQGLPLDKIKTMRAQGMDNNQIIQSLQREGYSSSMIFDSMNQVDMPSAEPRQQNFGNEYSMSPPSAPGFSANSYQDRPSFGAQTQPTSVRADSSTEELVEAIIDEKWNDLVRDLNKIVDWKNTTNNRMISLEQRFEDIRREFDKLHSAIISKIDDYDRNITNVGAEVKAMEKVFSKVLPVFTENVSELSRISKDFNKKPVPKKVQQEEQ